jgi:RNA polymerase sigma factor (TIGR02999 family)
MGATPETALLLIQSRNGDRSAFDLLFARVYEELRTMARQRLRRHRPGETLCTTALVHEAYLRLSDRSAESWQDRAHFLAIASRAMRYILLDHARAQQMQKRGGGARPVSIDGLQLADDTGSTIDLLALDQALERLADLNEAQARLVEYRFFGGLSYEEVAQVTGASLRTVKRDWARARTWLFTFMQE